MGKVIELYNRKEERRMHEFSVLIIARVFLSFSCMSQKKLQKLCYYAQAWHLALFNRRLMPDRFEAWVHGPVSPILYSEYREYGWFDIPMSSIPKEIENRDDVYNFLQVIWGMYGNKTADELEIMTHNEAPWNNARIGVAPWEPSDNVVDLEDMRNYYGSLLNNN